MLLFAFCGAWVVASWSAALSGGNPGSPEHNLAAAAFAICGLGMILFPIDWAGFCAEHGEQKLTKFAQMSRPWKILFVVAPLIALLNAVALSQVNTSRTPAPHPTDSANRRTWNEDLSLQIFTVLLAGGVVVLLASAHASVFAKLYSFFGGAGAPKLGLWMFVTGIAMVTFALLLLAAM